MRHVLLVLAVGLTACGGAEPGEETAALEVNTLTVDFEDTADAAVSELQGLSEEFAVVEMAARTQDAFRVNRSAVFTVQAYDDQREMRVNESFDLKNMDRTDSPVLTAHEAPGFVIHTFTLAEDDASRILAVRQTLSRMKTAAPGENELSLNAYVTGCLKDPNNRPEDLKLSVFLRIRPDGDFFPFFSEQVLPASGPAYAASFWTPCEESRDS
ncbi:MAG: hypothetical protein MRY64_01565 [Hyphomonadaceae bacterium]|nr:hypothetical protein [Hyphomonadaceae bacterium]